MGKSLDEIYRKMQQQQVDQRRSEMLADQQIREINEQQRREWVERNRLYERSFNPSSAASAAAGSGGGSIKKVSTTFLTFSFQDIKLYYVTDNGAFLTDIQPFFGITTLCDCLDDNDYIYYVTYESDSSIFGKMSKSDFSRTDIDTVNLNTLSPKSPSSMYYEGSGNFIYLSPSLIDYDGVGEIYRISQDGQTVNQLSTIESGDPTLGICEVGGVSYASTFIGNIISALNTLDINTFGLTLIDYFSMNGDSLPEGIVNTKVWTVWDLVKYEDKVYANVIFNDKDTFTLYQIIGEINLEDATIKYHLPISGDITEVSSITSSLVIY